MRLIFNTEQEAQAAAATIHARMLATDAGYAQSVDDGQTVRWAQPKQFYGETQWSVAVGPRCANALPDGITLDDALPNPPTPPLL